MNSSGTDGGAWSSGLSSSVLSSSELSSSALLVLLSRALGRGRWIVLLILLIALGRRGFLLLWWWGFHLLIRWRQLRCPWGDHQRDRHLQVVCFNSVATA